MDIAKHKNGPTYVFLYYTESGGKKSQMIQQMESSLQLMFYTDMN